MFSFNEWGERGNPAFLGEGSTTSAVLSFDAGLGAVDDNTGIAEEIEGDCMRADEVKTGVREDVENGSGGDADVCGAGDKVVEAVMD